MGTITRYAATLTIGCLLGAIMMHAVYAQAPALKRMPLYKADLTGVEGKEVIMTLIDAAPGAEVPPTRIPATSSSS